MFDVAIIGGGPAGLSAALTAKNLQKSIIWLGGDTFGKVGRAELVQNYPGLPSASGGQLAKAFSDHARVAGLELTKKLVTGVYDLGDRFTLLTEGEEFSARAVILCLGVQSSKPAEGEEEFLGRGVSYCATCDGMLYKGKKIAVAIYDKSFEHEAEFLASIAGTCCVLPLYKGAKEDFSGASAIKSAPVKFEGDMRLRRVILKDGSALEVDGAFILKSSIPPATLVHGLKTEDGKIVVDRAMRTNIRGVFAAGDCTGAPYQYAKAVGEGNVAMHSAAAYLR